MELPVWEMLLYMIELADQIKEENEAVERAGRR